MIMNDRWSYIDFDGRQNYIGLRSERRVKDGFQNDQAASPRSVESTLDCLHRVEVVFNSI